MPDFSSPAAVHADHAISVTDFFMALKRSRRLRPLLIDAFVESYLVTLARKAGLRVTPEELQKAADDYRLRNGLASSEQTQQWLSTQGITSEDFAAGLERDLVVEKLRSKIADGQIPGAFDAQTARFARVRLKRILVATETEARNIIDDLSHGRTTFADAARAHSLDLGTRLAGGETGVVRRVDLVANVAEAVFAAPAGKVVGPVPLGQGFLVLEVTEFLPAELDETIQAGLRKEIFESWLRTELGKSPIDFPVMVELSK